MLGNDKKAARLGRQICNQLDQGFQTTSGGPNAYNVGATLNGWVGHASRIAFGSRVLQILDFSGSKKNTVSARSLVVDAYRDRTF
jgi:hypothetical protein